MIVRSLHGHCVAADVTGSRKLFLHPGYSYVHQILSFPSNCAEDDLRSKSCLMWQLVRLKGRRLDASELTHHHLFFLSMASCVGFFPFCSSFDIAVAINEERPQSVGSDRLMTSLYIEKCFRVSNIWINLCSLNVLSFLRANFFARAEPFFQILQQSFWMKPTDAL